MLQEHKIAVDIANNVMRKAITSARDAARLLANLDIDGANDAQLGACLEELSEKTKVIRGGLNNAQTAADFMILINEEIEQLEQGGSLPFSDAPGSLERAEVGDEADDEEDDDQDEATAEELEAADAAPGAVKHPGAKKPKA